MRFEEPTRRSSTNRKLWSKDCTLIDMSYDRQAHAGRTTIQPHQLTIMSKNTIQTLYFRHKYLIEKSISIRLPSHKKGSLREIYYFMLR